MAVIDTNLIQPSVHGMPSSPGYQKRSELCASWCRKFEHSRARCVCASWHISMISYPTKRERRTSLIWLKFLFELYLYFTTSSFWRILVNVTESFKRCKIVHISLQEAGLLISDGQFKLHEVCKRLPTQKWSFICLPMCQSFLTNRFRMLSAHYCKLLRGHEHELGRRPPWKHWRLLVTSK